MTTKHPTHLVVDGSNIATEGRNTPSLEQLDEAVRAILEEFPHERLTVVVDATFGHRIAESERPAYEEAILAGEIVAPPAGAIGRGDAFILQVADKAGATVFSNDSFQEFHGEHEWLFDEGRLIGGKPVPGVGWVFVPRVPVRGPLSRRAVRESKRGKATTRRTKETAAEPKRGRQPSPTASQPMPTPTAPPPAKRREPAPKPAAPAAPAAPVEEAPSLPPVNGNEALNEPTVFLSFIAQNRIGSVVEAVVDHFSSHGAYVVAGGARCYLPTKTMGDPPPNRARDVINRGDVVRVEVQSLDAERRGINVRYVELVESRDLAERRTESATDHGDEGPPEWSDELEPIPAQQPRSDSDVATRKTAAKRTATKKAPSGRPVEELEDRRAPVKKAAAEATPSPRAAKAAARKVPAKKAASRRTAATEDVAPFDDRPIDEPAPPTKKAAAKRTTKRSATKATAAPVEDIDTDVPAGAGTEADAPIRKATARKATAKKAATKKATAKKATTKKAATKKATARRSAAGATAADAGTEVAGAGDDGTGATKKATAKKATTRKAAAKKATTKKAATKKATAAKATDTANARRATTKRTAAGATRSRTTKKAAAAGDDAR